MNADYPDTQEKEEIKYQIPKYPFEEEYDLEEHEKHFGIDFISEINLQQEQKSLLPIHPDVLNLEAFDKAWESSFSSQSLWNPSRGPILEEAYAELSLNSENLVKSELFSKTIESTNETKLMIDISSKEWHYSKPKNIKRKKSHLSAPSKKRKDIAFKSLLRRCRKFYQCKFNSFCDYSTAKKRKSINFYYEKIQEFVRLGGLVSEQVLGDGERMADTVFYMG